MSRKLSFEDEAVHGPGFDVNSATFHLPSSPESTTIAPKADGYETDSFEMVSRANAPSNLSNASQTPDFYTYFARNWEEVDLDEDDDHDENCDEGSRSISAIGANGGVLVEPPNNSRSSSYGTATTLEDEDAARKLKRNHDAALGRGDDLQAALDAMRLSYQIINQKSTTDARLTAALRENARLEKALERAVQECRNAVVAAQELTYTNNSLHVMISDLQGHIMNQQDAEEQAARLAGQTVKRQYARQSEDTMSGAISTHWHHPLWLSVGHLHPALKAAEVAWWGKGKMINPQAALLCVRTILQHRQSNMVVEKDAHAPLSDIGILANLLHFTILLVAKQCEQALEGAERMIHEARASGLIVVERRAQWLRGHALLALERPQDARICFSFCGGPGMPENAVRDMREYADQQIDRLPMGHPGREISQELPDFYYHSDV